MTARAGHTHSAPAVVELIGAAVSYPTRPPVDALLPTDLAIGHGEFVSIVGPSGSGKSTLLNVLGLIDRPTAGVRRFDGVDTAGLRERELTEIRGTRIGFVFQAFHLVGYRSVLENVALGQLYSCGSRRDRIQRAAECLADVGLDHRATAFPSTLSGGEMQRVAIARALTNQPDLLLCDEPTGNLDSRNGERIIAILAEMHERGVAVVVITHDDHVARQAHRRLTIRDGMLSDVLERTVLPIDTRR